MRQLRYLFVILTLSTLLVTASGIVAYGATANPAEVLKGKVAGKAGYKTEATIDSVATSVIVAFLSLLGVFFLGLLVYGGFRWMNAQGNEEEITKAKSIITQAIIGLVIIMAAYAITSFVTTRLESTALGTE